MQSHEKRRAPLVCTANKGEHVDYGMPIIFRKSTDYRTSTKRAHDFVPSVPQNFNCEVKAIINPQLKDVDYTIIEEGFKSTYDASYQNNGNSNNPLSMCYKAPRTNNYGRVVEEQIKKDPPPPRLNRISTMKDNYRMNFYTPKYREAEAPDTIYRCELKGLGRAEQPPVRPEEKGFWKYLDIYTTDNQLKYPPYSKDQLSQSREDIITFYSASGKWKEPNMVMPRKSGNSEVFDRTFFKREYPWKRLSRGQKNVPGAMSSTYRESYIPHEYSDMSPYIGGKNNEVSFDACLAEAGPWQNLCPPGMYCTESCHIGTGWPVRSVVNIGAKETLEHKPCFVQVKE